MGWTFDVLYGLHALASIAVSFAIVVRIGRLVRHHVDGLSKRSRSKAVHSSGKGNALNRAATLVAIAERGDAAAGGSSKVDEEAHGGSEELLDEVATDRLILAYLQVSLVVLLVEELPGFVLSTWRLVRVCHDVGLTLKTWAQMLAAMQFTFSAIMLGFQMCNLKDYIRLADAFVKREKKLAVAVDKTTTVLDAFEQVNYEEIALVLRVRRALGNALERLARDVAGDVMLLRHLRMTGAGQGMEEHAAIVVQTAAAVTSALARRVRSGADSARKRCLEDDVSFSTARDAEALQAIWPHNMFLS